jgi:predicted 3-demethylubiquinone-9 3-methyltransferase (glyoxalase superfamily)
LGRWDIGNGRRKREEACRLLLVYAGVHVGEPADGRFVFTKLGVPPMKKIRPSLWFDGNAEEAMNFYVSIFKDSEVLNVSRMGDGPDAQAFTVTFRLEDEEFFGINGGPQFTFTEAVSFYLDCDSQEEVDYYWDRLLEGGEPSQCGWLKDKFGLSWQIVPSRLGELMQDEDPEKANRVMQAMLKMTRIDLAGLQAAYDQEPASTVAD